MKNIPLLFFKVVALTLTRKNTRVDVPTLCDHSRWTSTRAHGPSASAVFLSQGPSIFVIRSPVGTNRPENRIGPRGLEFTLNSWCHSVMVYSVLTFAWVKPVGRFTQPAVSMPGPYRVVLVKVAFFGLLIESTLDGRLAIYMLACRLQPRFFLTP